MKLLLFVLVLIVAMNRSGKCARISHGKITFPGPMKFTTTWRPTRRFALHSDNSEKRMLENELEPLSPYERKEAKEGWNYVDTWNKDKDPHEKTISLQIMEDDWYDHNRPSWPNDEYFGNYDTTRSNLTSDSTTGTATDTTAETNRFKDKNFEWKRLRPYSSSYYSSGPGYYDYKSGSSTASASASAGSASSGSGHHNHYYPIDYPPRRKRYRVQIHPGLIAAPIAGIAAYKAVSAFTTKPLLLELGLVTQKDPDYDIGPGWGWFEENRKYRPYRRPLRPLQGDVKYPILRPKPMRTTSWWNPFAAITPRLPFF